MKRLDDLRIMAHRVEMHGASYPLCIACISADRKKVDFIPFTQEVHSTPFHNGLVKIMETPDGYYFFAP